MTRALAVLAVAIIATGCQHGATTVRTQVMTEVTFGAVSGFAPDEMPEAHRAKR